MKQRYTYAILYGLPGIFVSAFIAILIGSGAMGVFWLWVFGDSEWPDWAQWVVNSIAIVALVISFFFIVQLGYRKGNNIESKNIPVSKKSIILSIIAFLFLFALMIIYQQGYVFNPPDSNVCRDMCIENGYDGSGSGLSPASEPPVICSCFNGTTKEWDDIGELN